MDDSTAIYIGSLRDINDALIRGLHQVVISALENVDKLTKAHRLSLLDKLKELVAAGQRVYENEPRH